LDTTSNPLGSFSRLYELDLTPRLKTLTYQTPGLTANFHYLTATNDMRLDELKNAKGTSVLSKHNYSYDPEGQIQSWTKTLGANVTPLAFEYDDAKQLLGVTQGDPFRDSSYLYFGYNYDAAGNRVLASASTIFTHTTGGTEVDSIYHANDLNQLTA
jgi:hypothetical protein